MGLGVEGMLLLLLKHGESVYPKKRAGLPTLNDIIASPTARNDNRVVLG